MQQKFTLKSIFSPSLKLIALSLFCALIALTPFAQKRGVRSTEYIPTSNDAGIQNKQSIEQGQLHRNEAICATFSGTLEAGDLTLGTGRMFRDGVASTCAAPKTCPGPFGPVGNWYDIYTYTNPSSSPQCITVTFTNTSTNTNSQFVSAYVGTFSSSNTCTNYVADQGSSAGAGLSNSFSFTLPGSATVELVVTSITVGIGGSYLMTVDAPNCSSTPCAGSPSPGNTIASPNTVCPGINFTLSLQNNPQVGGLSYQWQKASASTGLWTDSTGATNFSLTATQGESAKWWRCVVTCATSSLSTNSNPVLVGNGRGVFTTQPANATVRCESTASFTVAATGYLLTWTWQFRVNSSSTTWFDVTNTGVYTGATTSTLTLTNMPETMNGYQYRALMRGPCTAVDFSNPATLTLTPITATSSPTSATICKDSILQLTITNALGSVNLISEGFNVVSPLPTGWSQQNLSNPVGPSDWFQGNTGAFTAQSGATNSYIAANWQNTTTTGSGTISNWLIAPNVTFKNGDVLTFWTRKVSPDDFPDRLQVRMSTNGASTNVGTSETSVGDFTTLLREINPTLITGVYPLTWTQYTITISGLTMPTSGRIAFRYFVTDGGGSAPNSDYIGIDNVVLTSTGASTEGTWTSNPASPNTMFTDAGASMPYVVGSLASSIYVKPTVNTVYSLVFTSPTPCTSAPTNINVNVVNPLSAVVDPTDKSVCIGGNTSFSVSASGGPITYQWQVSTDGGTIYNPISGATSATLNLNNVTLAMDNNRYRVVLTAAPCIGSITSTAAKLTVNPLPTVGLTVSPLTSLRPQLSTLLTTTSSPAGASYSWTFNGAPLTGVTTSTYTADIDGIGTYTVRVTDVNGCVNTTSPITITNLFDDRMFIYPSPTLTGQFQVRLYSGINFDYRSISVYNSVGQRVYKRPLATTTTEPWKRIDVDLSALPSGVYIVEVSDEFDTKRATGKLIIQR